MEFRNMRRFRQQIPEAECIEILQKADHGIMAVLGDDDYPYTVPVNHVYEDGKIYFHCAVNGHKTDAIRNHDKVSFCVIADGQVMPEMLDTRYVSVVCFGRARIVEDPQEKRRIGMLVGQRFSGDYMSQVAESIEREMKLFYCVEITIEHMTGKESKDLMKERAG